MVSNELRSVTHADPSVTCQAKFAGEDQPRSGQVSVKSVDASGAPEVDVALVPSVKEQPLSDSRGSVAGVVADALEGQLGEKPKVDCGGGFVVLKDGQELTCAVSSASGESLGEARVKLRDVTCASYAVDVALNQSVVEEKN